MVCCPAGAVCHTRVTWSYAYAASSSKILYCFVQAEPNPVEMNGNPHPPWQRATKNAVVGLSRSVCRETVGFDPQAVVGCDQAPIYSLGHLLARHYKGRLPVAGP